MGLKKSPRYVFLTIGYAILIQVAYLAALLVRFDFNPPARWLTGYFEVAPLFTILSLIGFFFAGLYHGLWRYASTVTLFQVFKGVTLSALSLVIIWLVTREQPLFPRTLIVLVWLWELVLLGGVRFAWRISREKLLGPSPSRSLRTLVVGADHTGVHLIQEMRRSDHAERLTPIGFIDDEARLSGHMIEGIKVLGTIADLPRVLQERRAEMVVVSDPDMPAKVVREIANFCAEANVRVQILPGLSDFSHGRPVLSQMRDMRIEDLLGRQPVHLDLNEVGLFLRGQRVLVTGAGGSIGSEIARQIAGFEPAELVLLDHAENGLYYAQNEIAAMHPSLPMQAIVTDIQDHEGVEIVFRRCRPSVVFHAAAHKHVPLLEANPREAILNNVLGTRNLVRISDRYGVGKFVLISTDKAVNPTSVMGASKRVCEMLVQSRSQKSRTDFVAVRFGNVLGSDGSVIPLFQRQIARGGPITVTHPDARRFFMTIPEAVRLVLQAGAMGHSGEVLLLDMGEQVRIVDLARQLIRMSGLREGEDIEIVFTGLRPGEKLYEELHSDTERTRMTRHERIFAWDLDAKDEQTLLTEVAGLESVASEGDPEAIKVSLQKIVPEYAEPRHDPLEEAPTTPIVELPAAAHRLRPVVHDWSDTARALVEGAVAATLLAMSLPLWGLIWFEARRRGEREFLLHEVRIGKTRRFGQRRTSGKRIHIDRRSIERRTQDLLGAPIRCARFRNNLGPVSRWVYRRRLEKIPYLLNVLRYEMALVGPRPEKERHVLRWEGVVPDYQRRFTELPGVTGLAQITDASGPTLEAATRRTQYDLYYVDHRSALLDIRTMLRTVAVIFWRPRDRGRTQPPKAGNLSPRSTGHSAQKSANSGLGAEYRIEDPPAVKGVTR